MKKFVLSVIILQIIFLVGCGTVENENPPVNNAEEIPEVSEVSESTVLEDDSIYVKFDEVYDLQSKEEVHIRKINEDKFLLGFQDQFGYQMNPTFNIYDVITDRSIAVDGQLEFIDEIRIENNQVEFFSKGTNIINGFKKFPNITEVDIETGLTKNENIYSRLGSDYKPYYLGNFMNETKLQALKIKGKKIIFDFSVSENSILAGGDHCPNIEVISENENYLSVDVENLILKEEDINTIARENFIKNIEVNSYKDGRDIKHSVLEFNVEDFTEYTCGFETGDDGIKDLIISFK